ncbi:hypothetical protein [Insolitispirillum peregrinum]|uniref:Uncharacterized protein n=1 Tax=Insolitispirillum peregrinum TaxID=80876 RepID=A0A1N7ND27_9PROT|nr:hypothetical protein [Insolitispirillum peregrinum]SIS96254.1 hypothetical protein SAMN05421779_10536 [Insolitispirillum peregrinum]
MSHVTALKRETATQTVRTPGAAVKTETGKTLRPSHKWAVAGVEPSVMDMLRDPLVQLVMARDAINADDVDAALARAQAQLAELV